MLLIGGVGVDLEFGSQGEAVGVIALGVDAVSAGRILAEAFPGDDEVSGGVHRHGGIAC